MEVQENTSIFIIFVAWCTTEVVRYPNYALNCFGTSPYVLTYLRYTLFIVLYPTGFVGELWLMYKALPFIKKKNLYEGLFAGLPFSYSGIVLGLLKVNEDGASVLASQFNGTQISFADDAKPYDPSTNETSLVLDNLAIANGVALSRNEDYLIVCETWKFRCLKYWLKDEILRGKTEIFIDNLPGAPDNINLAPDGSLHLLMTFPRLIKLIDPTRTSATVVNVGDDGKIVRVLDDHSAKVVSFVTSALEFEGNLYLGSLNNDFIGKLPLKKT
ncbi:hypothetical protein POM88_023663 [Heracleum sosnowskyi]|uniref:very-long-chain (3R)-3-hydroxyacyl-CoA dehydratase n=1 Tax=Heracleum sosnowskyi TaxID=360622 RepID=A0AAD8IIQ9_9APIA|nr:hypothetical protein POM88_023663 [Heracleum sosnowskyi]